MTISLHIALCADSIASLREKFLLMCPEDISSLLDRTEAAMKGGPEVGSQVDRTGDGLMVCTVWAPHIELCEVKDP